MELAEPCRFWSKSAVSSTRETLDVALESGADMVGFVFFPPSPRNLGFDAARDLGVQAAGRALKVALLVDADDALIAQVIEALHPDMLQLHGNETPARVTAVKARFGLPVMKVLAASKRPPISPRLPPIATWPIVSCSMRAPRKRRHAPAGLGKPFDWTLLTRL